MSWTTGQAEMHNADVRSEATLVMTCPGIVALAFHLLLTWSLVGATMSSIPDMPSKNASPR